MWQCKMYIGCSKMHESPNFMVAGSHNWLFYPTKSLQKELGFFQQNCGSAQFLKFWVYHNGKRAPGGAKICNFQKLAWYSPENGNAWTKSLPHHFGGCFARFLESVRRFGRSKCHFLALENGHFCQNGGVDIWFMRFHSWASIKPIFKIWKF